MTPSNRSFLSRREWFARGAQTVTGLAVAAALHPELPALAAEPAAPGKKPAAIRFGFTTYQWGKDWDIPALIANCAGAGALAVELRTQSGYAHGVELDLDAARRREVKQRFADSPVTLLGLATSEKFDWPEPEKLQAAIDQSKEYLKLSRDIGASGIRVFPNDFPKNVPHERTLTQIAKALDAVGAFATELGQKVRLECHGPAGNLPDIRTIMEQVSQPSVRILLNSEPRNAEGEGFEANFNLVKDYLGDALHLHDLQDEKFPYQLQFDLLAKQGWNGWALLEASHRVPDRVEALRKQRLLFDRMTAKAS